MMGDILQELRKDKNWSQAVLGEKLGLSKSAIGTYESEKSEPTYETLIKIAELFDVNIDYLLGHSRERISWASINSSINTSNGTISFYTIKYLLQTLNISDRTFYVELLHKLVKLQRIESLTQDLSGEDLGKNAP